jgi:protease-4
LLGVLLTVGVGGGGAMIWALQDSTHLGGAHGKLSPGAQQLTEAYLENHGSDDKIAVLAVEGVITGSPLESGGRTLADLIKQQLERAAADEAVKAVILKVDSPGGEVLASDDIYRVLWDFMEGPTGKPVVVSMGSLAASGGYYVAAPCRWIVANELTMTGSIGVIFHSYNYRGLMDKVGVRPAITKSGKLKDMMSGEKREDEELPEERQILQSMIDETYGKFKAVIRAGRERAKKLNESEGRALAANWESIADGRILSGQAALDQGLVDELGNFETAVKRAEKLADISGANLVTYDPPPSFGSFFSLLGQANTGRGVKVDLGLPRISSLPSGRLYFLSPLHAP